uniref:(northern house mosquito) hypothetical protein n=1 Tax=Culex pipiens TaxID=7175 RepID=A0A8D8G479_CULPI
MRKKNHFVFDSNEIISKCHFSRANNFHRRKVLLELRHTVTNVKHIDVINKQSGVSNSDGNIQLSEYKFVNSTDSFQKHETTCSVIDEQRGRNVNISLTHQF